MEETLPGRVRFGAFELDLKSGELWEGGRKIVLPEQPFLVLRILVERGGEVVSREEIQKRLWPNDTVVEFDHSINAVINRLRRVLNDSAEEPKYIETVARRGYRLLAPVQWLESSSSDVLQVKEASDNPEGLAQSLGLKPETLTGKTVTHYRVLDIIGGGGMGVVYRAEDIKLGRAVALKFLPEDLGQNPRALERFEREARAASALEHSNICSIYEFGEHEGRPFIVMQLLQGQTLRDRLSAVQGADPTRRRQAPFTTDALLDIAIQISQGLEAAHEKGIIHRDIKPANIFLTDKSVVKILDFGLAKLLEPSQEMARSATTDTRGDLPTPTGLVQDTNLTRIGTAVGTAAYMSPEQVKGGQVDARTDLFSFGVVLYEMATGQRAFNGETEAIVHAAIATTMPVAVHELNATLPPGLEAIINKAMQKERGQRYQSAAAMRADLEGLKRVSEASTPLPLPPEPPRPPVRRKRRFAVALLVCAAVGVGVYLLRPKKINDIVLADFTNSASDPVFNDSLNTALRVELEQTPFLNLLAPDKVRGTLKQLNYGESEKLTPELAREVCRHSNSKAVVAGRIVDAGNRYRIELDATDCQTGKTLAKRQVETADRNQVVNSLGKLSSQLRGDLGEPGSSLRAFSQPLEQATSSSPEALQAFTSGLEQRLQRGDIAALPYFKRAVELDPKFAEAYAAMGIGYRNIAEAKLSIENLRKAHELRDRLTQRQRFSVDGAYSALATGDLQKAVQTFAEWARIYPKDPIARYRLSASSLALGQLEEAATQARESIRLRPMAAAYTNEVSAYLKMDKLDEAKRGLDEAQALHIGSSLLPIGRYMLAFRKGDQAALENLVNSTVGPSRGGLLCLQSYTEMFYGRVNKARGLLQQVVNLASQEGHADSAANCIHANGLQEVEVGNAAQAQQQAAAALALSGGRDARASVALILARAGDVAGAQKLADELAQEYPQDTMIQNYSLPTIRAAIELQKNNPAKAIDILTAAVPYEMGFASFEYFYPAYVRGNAYLKAGQAQQAAAEFQKMLDHPGIMENSVLGPLAHLQLGRAQAMAGDKGAARKSYEDVFAIWKDADPDVPVLQQARAEYAALH